MTALVSPPGFYVMIKPQGAICNLARTYCYFLPKEKLSVDPAMRFMANELAHQRTPANVMTWMLTRGKNDASKHLPAPAATILVPVVVDRSSSFGTGAPLS